ncbi:MAG: hypothetical protein L6437_07295 [Kiritimatiellae bacterium]|nr:hypothetical protein [Kiritimatiellia bacterium]
MNNNDMTTPILIIGMICFLPVLLIHIILWNVFKPKSEILTLLVLFIGLPFGMLGIAGLFSAVSTAKLFSIALLYFSLTGAYIQTYPGFASSIPSFKILRAVHNSDSHGLSAREIINIFQSQELVESRMQLLYHDRLIASTNGKLALTLPGKALVFIFITYRKLLGLPVGKG